jgi:hypothetical protein
MGSDTHAAAIVLATEGDFKKAVAELRAFHQKLCTLRVLDPACGSGNFLYVTLEHIKRLEGEVLDTLANSATRQGMLDLPGETVDPHQFLGLEINPRAAAIAEIVLWIGYLQWHFRTRGKRPPSPIIRNFHNIECRDAVLAYDRVEPVLDADGPAAHPLGRPRHQTPPGHRPRSARRIGPRAAERITSTPAAPPGRRRITSSAIRRLSAPP